jgi:uncharacterized membrane protein YphA (DoxX/SURF4 family)
MILRRIARPMLAGVFLSSAISTLRNPTPAANRAAPLVAQAHSRASDDLSRKLTRDPETVVRAGAGVQAAAAALFATGRAPRLAALALAATHIPATYVNYPFWKQRDPEARAQEQAEFLKNVGLLGGVLLATADTEGKPSLAWRSRQGIDRATAALAGSVAAMRHSGDSGQSFAKLGEGLSTVADKVREASAVAAEKGSELSQRAAEKGAEFYSVAADKGSELLSTAAERGSALYGTAAETSADLSQRAAQKGSILSQRAVEKGSELSQRAAERGPSLGQRAAEVSSELSHRAAEAGSRLSHLAAEKGSELSHRAAEASTELSHRASERAKIAAAQLNGHR